MKKILMVCLGNICRSPMAEGILRAKIEEKGLSIAVDSAGTSHYHIGESPDVRAIEKMKAHGIEIAQLKARQFGEEDFDRFDRIFVMDSSNYSDVLSLVRSADDKDKVQLLLNVSYPGSNRAVPDPYFGGLSGFDQVYQLLDEACEKVVRELEGGK